MKQKVHTDIFIAGAGPAGIAAAVAAAELGMNVCVAEKKSYPGGRATASAVGTVCGLYLRSHSSAEFAMIGFPKRFAEKFSEFSPKAAVPFSEGLWFLPSHPDDFEKTARSFLENNKIQVFYNTTVVNIESSEKKVVSIHCVYGNDEIEIIPKCVIDCSGEGVICSLVNHDIIHDEEYQASAFVFSLKDVSCTDEFQLRYLLLKHITRQIDEELIPEFYNLLGIIPHSFSSGSLLLKMGLPWKTGNEDLATIDTKARALVNEIYDFLKRSVPGFERSEIEWMAREVGVRTGIRVKGKYLLTGDDVLSCRKAPDSVCNGAWPVEFWRTGEKRVEMTFFSEQDYYSIPAGCLESGELENLFFAGKIISADEKAIASARVIGTCLGTGYAAGVLASYKSMNRSRDKAVEYIQKQMLVIK